MIDLGCAARVPRVQPWMRVKAGLGPVALFDVLTLLPPCAPSLSGVSGQFYTKTGRVGSDWEVRHFKHNNWGTEGVELQDPLVVFVEPWTEQCCASAYFNEASFNRETGEIKFSGKSALHGVSIRAYLRFKDSSLNAMPVDRGQFFWDGVPDNWFSNGFRYELPSFGGDWYMFTRWEIDDGRNLGVINYWDSHHYGKKPSGCGGRTKTQFQVKLMPKRCEAGQYQTGQDCNTCPADTFNLYRNQVQQDSVIPCEDCSCAECETCQPHDASCPVTPGRCNIDGVCYTENDERVSETWPEGDPCVQCRYDVADRLWTGVSGNTCDDRVDCTRVDTCHDGICFGTPYTCLMKEHTGNDWEACEVCNGDGCDQDPEWTGCRKDGKCGCLIDGVCFAHGERHPLNSCWQCDAGRHANAWVVSPPEPCDDGLSCTYDDTCDAGVCVGVPYSCPMKGALCLESNECDGTGECIAEYKPAGTVCAEALGVCTPAQSCTGDKPFCPPQVTYSPVIDIGEVVITRDDLRAAQPAPAVPSSSALNVSLVDWRVECGELEVKWGLIQDGDGIHCEPQFAADAVGGGFSDYLVVPQQELRPSLDLSRAGLSLRPTQSYRAIVQVRNLLDEVVTACSDSVIVDVSAPLGGVVVDRDPLTSAFTDPSEDAAYHHQAFLLATWTGFTDHESSWSGLLNYEWAVGALSPQQDRAQLVSDSVTGWTRVLPSAQEALSEGVLPELTVTTDSSVQLRGGWAYVVSVRATNKAGSATTVSSDGVVVDFTPPDPVLVNDGPAVSPLTSAVVHNTDIDGQNYTTIQAHWGAYSDGESPLARYDVAVGAEPFGFQQLAFTPVGVARSFGADDLAVFEGQRYYVTVRAWNAAGLHRDSASDGTLIDFSAPKGGRVLDLVADDAAFESARRQRARSTDVDFTYSDSTLRVSHSWIEMESFVAYGEAVVGLAGSGVPDGIAPLTRIDAPVGAVTGLQLVDGRTYVVCVRGTNAAGMTSALVCGDGVTVDLTPPEPGTVVDVDAQSGSLDDTDFHESGRLVAMWDGFNDPQSGIVDYLYEIRHATVKGPAGLSQDPSNRTVAVGWTSSAAVPQMVYSGNIKQGYAYFVHVRAINGACALTERSSDGVIVDFSPPSLGQVFMGARSRGSLAWLPEIDTIDAHWEGFDDAESGIASVQWAIGDCEGGATSVMDFTDLDPHATEARATGLPLAAGPTYCVSLRVLNGLGMAVEARSEGAAVDPSPPIVGSVVETEDPDLAVDVADIDFQTHVDRLWASWSGFSDPESGITYSVGIGNQPGEADVMAWAAVGEETQLEATGLELDGKRVFVTVVATNGAGVSVRGSSDGLIVDTTPPEVGEMRFGHSVWHSERYTMDVVPKANWDGFEDTGAPIESFEWSMGTAVGATDLFDAVPVGRATLVTHPSAEMQHGETYYLSLTASNEAGMRTAYEHATPVTVDISPPTCGTVVVADLGYSDNPQAVDWWPSREYLDLHFVGFAEPDSPLELNYAIGNDASGFGVQYSGTTQSLGWRTQVRLGSLWLTDGAAYQVRVLARNGAGGQCSAASSRFVVAGTPPSQFSAFDGSSGLDMRVSQERSALSVSWTPSTEQISGILRYDVAFGTNAAERNVVDWTAVDGGESASHASISVSGLPDATYFASVRAVSNAGLSWVAHTDGVAIDDSPPVGGTIADLWNPFKSGTNTGVVDRDFIAGGAAFHAAWDQFVEVHSALIGYEVALGSSAGDADVSAWRDVGLVSWYSWELEGDTAVPVGATVFVSVRATNSAGGRSVISSDGIVVVDADAPPVAGSVSMLSGPAGAPDPAFIFDVDELHVVASGFIAGGADGIDHYEVSLGSLPGGNGLAEFTSCPTADSCVVTGASVDHGVMVYATVRAISGAGLSTAVTSTGVFVDKTPPTSFVVADGPQRNASAGLDGEGDGLAGDVDVAPESQSLSAHWTPAFDVDSGLKHYVVGVGTQPGRDDIVDFAIVEADVTEWQSDTLVLAPMRYFVSVEAVNNAGGTTLTSSNGQFVDATPPSEGWVQDGLVIGTQEAFHSDAHRLSAHWGGFVEPESLVTGYEVGWGTSPGQTDLVDFIPVSLAVHFVFVSPAPLLTNGSTAYAVVRVSSSGGQSEVVSSGTTLDLTPPQAGTVEELRDTFNWDQEAGASGQHWIHASWQGFSDPISGIREYLINVGTSMRTSQLVSRHSVPGTNTSAVLGPLYFSEQTTVYVAVMAVNGAGLTATTADSHVLLMDVTPPTPFKVYDGIGPGPDVAYSVDFWHLGVHWDVPVDEESGLDHFEVKCGFSPGGSEMWDWTSTGLTPFYLDSRGPLRSGRGAKYYFSVRAFNTAGAYRTEYSDGFLLDRDGPHPGDVGDGVISDLDRDYQRSTQRLLVSWARWDEPDSFLTRYAVAAGSRPGAADVSPWVDVGLAERWSFEWKGSPWSGPPPLVEDPQRDANDTLVNVTQNSTTRLDNVTASNNSTLGRNASQGVDEAGWHNLTRNGTYPAAFNETLQANGTASANATAALNDTTSLNATVSGNTTAPLMNGTALHNRTASLNGTAGVNATIASIGSNTTANATLDRNSTMLGNHSSNVTTNATLDRNSTVLGNASSTNATIMRNSTSLRNQTALNETDPDDGELARGNCVQSANWSLVLPYEFDDDTGILYCGEDGESPLFSALVPGKKYYVSVRAQNNFDMWGDVASSDGVVVDVSPPEGGWVEVGLGEPFAGMSSTQDGRACDCGGDAGVWEGEVFSAEHGTCVCEAGFYRDGVGLCRRCLSGTHKHAVGDDGCLPCPVGSVADGDGDCTCSDDKVLADDRSACVCPAGSMLSSPVDSTSACISCPAGSYQSRDGAFTCRECPQGSLAAEDGSTCYCPDDRVFLDPGGYVAGSCVCPAGTFQRSIEWAQVWNETRYNATSNETFLVERSRPMPANLTCERCPDGTFSAEPGNLEECRACPVGTNSTSDGTSCDCSAVGEHEVFDSRRGVCVCDAGWARSGLSGQCSETCGMSSGIPFYKAAPGDACLVCPSRAAAAPWTSQSSRIFVRWGGFVDPYLGTLDHYLISIGTSPGGTQLRAAEDVGLSSWYVIDDVVLTPSVPTFVTVTAVDGVGLGTATVSGDHGGAVIRDLSAPTIAGVWDGMPGIDSDTQAFVPGEWGPSIDQVYTSDPLALTGHWGVVEDPDSDVTRVAVGVGSEPGATDIADARQHDDVASRATVGGLQLAHGARYYFTVVARNAAGLAASASSDGVVVDLTAPTVGTVVDNPSETAQGSAGVSDAVPQPTRDFDCQTGAAGVGAAWSAFSDAESGITSFAWAVGTEPGSADVRAWDHVGLQQAAHDASLVVGATVTTNTTTDAGAVAQSSTVLRAGMVLYASVRATNGAGLSAVATSDGVRLLEHGDAGGAAGGSPPYLCVAVEGFGPADLRIVGE